MKYFLTILIFILLVKPVLAAAPQGFLDLVNNDRIAGWAKDDDYSGPVQVHIYVDGIMVKALTADMNRDGVGNHAFDWTHPAFGPGNHQVNAYAIGVNSAGTVDNNNPELSLSPRTYTEPEEYQLNSADGKIHVVVNAKFGGAITKIFDDGDFPGKNLVNDSQAGAMVQSAFWLLPRHTSLPLGCSDSPDRWNDNPTQAGYVADGLKGNPIGIMGVNRTVFDPGEFIRLENNGQTVHLKNRFIRYDYCAYGDTPMDKRYLWDTNFYIEQWLSFTSAFPDTLVVKSKITYQGDGSQEISSGGGMIGIYAFNIPRAGYYANGQKIIDSGTGWDHPLVPIGDQNWAALIGQISEAGVGMVFAPGGRSDVDNSKFNFGIRGDSGQPQSATSLLYPLGAGANYNTVGITENVTVRDEPHPFYHDSVHLMHHYTFNNTSSFEWYQYFPIGKLDSIKTESEKILADTANFGLASPTPTSTPLPPTSTPPACTPCSNGQNRSRGDANCDGQVNLSDFTAWANQFLSYSKTNLPKSDYSADFNCDSKVTLTDFVRWRANFGK